MTTENPTLFLHFNEYRFRGLSQFQVAKAASDPKPLNTRLIIVGACRRLASFFPACTVLNSVVPRCHRGKMGC